MTIWILPEFTDIENGGQSVCSGSKAAITMRLPQTRKLVPSRAQIICNSIYSCIKKNLLQKDNADSPP